MDSYENIINQVFERAGRDIRAVQARGDLLTRTRFSGAKRLRAGALTASARFEHLFPLTFEFFSFRNGYPHPSLSATLQ